uniref:Glucagon receptor n=1 Tax=Lates calcarifer TaxID=8187 RepID=A0A4W6CV82_LATCA
MRSRCATTTTSYTPPLPRENTQRHTGRRLGKHTDKEGLGKHWWPQPDCNNNQWLLLLFILRPHNVRSNGAATRMNVTVQINKEPTPGGLLCRRMFDKYACWSDGQPNSTVKVPCPWYLPWYDQVRNGFVLRECGPDGQWATRNSSSTWSDTSQCEEKQMMVFTYFRVMYTVGYCVSLASLSLALIILLKLHCTRNYIHTNLFASFILRAVSILTRDALLSRSTPEQDLLACVAQVLMHYCVGANYYWLLVEGLYLHNLLVMIGENRFFRGYLLMGWGTPVLFVIPWIIVRYFFENTKCWEINENVTHWWIIRTPILLAILVNFFIFIRIIQILVSKLKAHQMRYTDFKFRLAKSTLTLIALLGIHEVVFSMLTEHTEGVIRNINLFFQLHFPSSQGLFVAILYCFVNKEVQAEIRRKWHRWKLGMTDLDVGTNAATCQISTCSDTKCIYFFNCCVYIYGLLVSERYTKQILMVVIQKKKKRYTKSN